MKKVKMLLTFFMCAVCIIPSIHADAVVMNWSGSIEADNDIVAIDSTGSMAPYIWKTADNVKEFSGYLEKKRFIPDIGAFKVTCKGDNTVKTGNSVELKAVFYLEAVDKKKVIWSVVDEEVARIEVSSDTLTCKVTGISEGTTKVEAKTEDGVFTGGYEIIVADDTYDTLSLGCLGLPCRKIKVTPAKKTITRKKSFNIKVTLAEDFKKDREEEEIEDIWESYVDSVTYRSNKSLVASVSKKGKVTGKKKGKAIITTSVALRDGSQFNYKTTVYVK